MDASSYRIVVEPLAEEDGGGFVASVPDLPGCMSDGESVEEARRNAIDAIGCWIEAAKAAGRPVPSPTPERAGV
jgi:predicted RNase H-like HicB family nuclease